MFILVKFDVRDGDMEFSQNDIIVIDDKYLPFESDEVKKEVIGDHLDQFFCNLYEDDRGEMVYPNEPVDPDIPQSFYYMHCSDTLGTKLRGWEVITPKDRETLSRLGVC